VNEESRNPAVLSTADPALSTQDAARYLGVSPVTLRKWRCEGIGPTWMKITEARVRYLRSDLDAWLASRPRYQSTSAAKAAVRSAAASSHAA
jgi:predicted DNA-binding transcriptional regulator AlpA